MKIETALIVALMAIAFSHPALAETECYGEGSYRTCTTITQHPDGSMDVYSSDNMGNSYRSSTDVDTDWQGNTTVTSHDSEGNSYSVHSWSDSIGGHTTDSLGNDCTVTYSGAMIGCD